MLTRIIEAANKMGLLINQQKSKILRLETHQGKWIFKVDIETQQNRIRIEDESKYVYL